MTSFIEFEQVWAELCSPMLDEPYSRVLFDSRACAQKLGLYLRKRTGNVCGKEWKVQQVHTDLECSCL